MQAVNTQSGRRLLALGCLAAFALLLGFGIQAALGYRRWQQNRETALRLVETLEERAAAEAESLRAASDTGEIAWPEWQRRLERLAVRKGAIWRAKELELLTLVNPWHPMPEGYEPALAHAESGYQPKDDYWVDVRCAEALTAMLNGCLASWNVPLICSAYRTQEMQEELFADKIKRLIEEGVSEAEAPLLAATTVALPGTSEHQLGLAVDLIDESYPYLTQGQEWTGAQRWLMEHCWEYGFILRYPNGTSEITGIIYEPWHYRYVGVQHAQAIRALGVTLEEYIALRRGR